MYVSINPVTTPYTTPVPGERPGTSRVAHGAREQAGVQHPEHGEPHAREREAGAGEHRGEALGRAGPRRAVEEDAAGGLAVQVHLLPVPALLLEAHPGEQRPPRS